MRVLLIVHGFPPVASGGTELYTDALARALAELGHRVLVLAREADAGRSEYAVRRARREAVEIVFVNNTFAACRSFEESYRNPRVASIAAALVDEFHPDIAHVQHLTCLSTELVWAMRARGIPVVFTPNDYWMMCHRGQLLDRDYRVCEGPGTRGCARCIGPAAAASAPLAATPVIRRAVRHAPGASAVFSRLSRWLGSRESGEARSADASLARAQHMRQVMESMALVLAPSRHMQRKFISFGVDAAKVVFHPQGIAPAAGSSRGPATGPLRVGFFGSLMVSKGARVLLEAFRSLPPGTAVLRVFGNPAPYHDDPRDDSRLIHLLKAPGVEHAGPIPHEGVFDELARVDAVAVPSIWPENAPFIIREALAARVPVVASRIGGIPELVDDGINGLLFEPGSIDDCARALRALAEDRALLARVTPREGPRLIADDARETVEWYRLATAAPRTLQHGRDLAAIVLNYHTPDETVLAVRSLLASDRVPDTVVVVDNDSEDAGASLRARLPGACVIPLDGNRGFAGGVNAGIRHALRSGASRVLLVNSDVVLAPDTVALLEEAMRARRGIGIAGPAVVSRSDPATVASLGMRFSASTGRMWHAGFGTPRASTAAVTRVVDAVSGCAMLIASDVFERVGLFDESYFFGFEDLELCLRARDAGFETVCCAHATAYHEGGVTIGARSPRRMYFATRNHLKLTAARGPHGLASAARQAAVVALNAAYVLRSPQVRLLPGLAALGRGVRHHLAGRYGSD